MSEMRKCCPTARGQDVPHATGCVVARDQRREDRARKGIRACCGTPARPKTAHAPGYGNEAQRLAVQHARSRRARQGRVVGRGTEEMEPDWNGECEVCGQSPIVPATGMCGPCTFGEAETIGGNW